MKTVNICCIGIVYVGGPTKGALAIKCPDIKVTLVDAIQQRKVPKNSIDLDQLHIYEYSTRAKKKAYDPKVKEARIPFNPLTLWEAINLYRDKIEAKFKRCVVRQEYHSAPENSFAASIVTKRDEFVSFDWKAIAEKMMLPAMVFDGRNVINTNKVINILLGDDN